MKVLHSNCVRDYELEPRTVEQSAVSKLIDEIRKESEYAGCNNSETKRASRCSALLGRSVERRQSLSFLGECCNGTVI